MAFIRTLGLIAGAALVSTGVASPLGGVFIAGALSVPANLGADEIDRAEARRKADKAADEARRNAEAHAENERRHQQEERDRAEAAARQQREHVALPQNAIDVCRSGQLSTLATILERMDDAQFEGIGLRLLAVCPSAQIRMQAQQIVLNEETRRETLHLNQPRP